MPAQNGRFNLVGGEDRENRGVVDIFGKEFAFWSRVEGRGSLTLTLRVTSRGSRVNSRGSSVNGRGSRVTSRGSKNSSQLFLNVVKSKFYIGLCLRSVGACLNELAEVLKAKIREVDTLLEQMRSQAKNKQSESCCLIWPFRNKGGRKKKRNW